MALFAQTCEWQNGSLFLRMSCNETEMVLAMSFSLVVALLHCTPWRGRMNSFVHDLASLPWENVRYPIHIYPSASLIEY